MKIKFFEREGRFINDPTPAPNSPILEQVKKVTKQMKKICKSRTSCKGCPFRNNEIGGCRFDGNPINWEI